MVRRALSLTPAFSLLLCLIAAAIWARGYWIMDHFVVRSSLARQIVVASSRGQCGVIEWTALRQPPFGPFAPPFDGVRDPKPLEMNNPIKRSDFAGFAVQRRANPWGYERRVLVHWWFIVGLLAVLPVGQFVWGRRRRINVTRTGYRAADAAPQWNEIGEQVLCPLCDYNLRGLAEPRCPECGYQFAWPDLLDPARRRHPYLFEHQSRRGLRCFARTLTRDLRPGEFWKTLYPTQPRNRRRLIIYQAACSLVAVAPTVLMVLAWWRAGGRSTWWLNGFSAWGAYQRFVWLTRFGAWGAYERFVMVQAVFMAALPPLTFATLLIFQHSMRHARVKAGHAMRCAVYSGDVVFWNGLWQLGILLLLGPYPQFTREEPGIVLLLMVGIVTAFVLIFLRLWSAYRNYMKFPDAFATALMSQAIMLTAFCALAAPSLCMVLLG